MDQHGSTEVGYWESALYQRIDGTLLWYSWDYERDFEKGLTQHKVMYKKVL